MNDWQFQFTLPQAPDGQLVECSHQEMENILLQRLKTEPENGEEVLWDLARFYCSIKDFDKSLTYMNRLLLQYKGLEQKASCLLALGCLMEEMDDYESAIRYYKEALSMEPMNTDTWYFINNNLGFSLNQLGHFEEGECYCRAAIIIDSNRSNGYKNLGISLEGQFQFRQAAFAYMKAVQVNAADNRALIHLKELLSEHPELETEFVEGVRCCEEAVNIAEVAVEEHRPPIYRGFSKKWLFFKVWMRRLLIKIQFAG